MVPRNAETVVATGNELAADFTAFTDQQLQQLVDVSFLSVNWKLLKGYVTRSSLAFLTNIFAMTPSLLLGASLFNKLHDDSQMKLQLKQQG